MSKFTMADNIPEEDEEEEDEKDERPKIPMEEIVDTMWTLVSEGKDKDLRRVLDLAQGREIPVNETSDEFDEDGGHILIFCVKQGCIRGNGFGRDYIQCARILLERKIDLDIQDKAERTALHWSVIKRNSAFVILLMNAGADIDVQDHDGDTPFMLAVKNGYCDIIKNLTADLSNKQIFSSKDGKGTPALVAAVQKGHLDVCQVLLENGAEINAVDKKPKRTALQYAVLQKRLDIFDLLLQYKPRLDKADFKGKTALHRICAIKDPRYFQKVIRVYGTFPGHLMEQEAEDGVTPVILACQNGNSQQLKELLEQGASVTSVDSSGRTALHYCADNLETQCAEMLLAKDSSLLEIKDSQGFTPLHMSVISGNAPLLKLLLKKGADLKSLDNELHTPAHWATVCGHLEILDILIEAGAELSTPDSHNAYPIHYAAQMNGKDNGHSDQKIGEKVLKKLLDSGVPCDVTDKDGRQPLLWAASAGNVESCRLLVKSGADPNAIDKDGLSAMHCAASRGHTKCVDELKKLGSEVNLADKNNCTALFYSITLGNKECTRTLLKYGADPNHKDVRGRTPSHCASVKGCIETVKMLDKSKADLWDASARGDCPVHEAAQGGHCDVVKYLLKWKNAPDAVNTANSSGRTCLHIAAIVNNLQLCKLLLDNGAERNAIMTHKDKNYTPYDAAILKENHETAEYIKAKGGVTGGDIENIIQKKGKRDSKSAKSRKSTTSLTDHPEEKEEEVKEKEKEKEDEKEDEKNKKKEAVEEAAKVAVVVENKDKKEDSKKKGEKEKQKEKEKSEKEKKEEEEEKSKTEEEKLQKEADDKADAEIKADEEEKKENKKEEKQKGKDQKEKAAVVAKAKVADEKLVKDGKGKKKDKKKLEGLTEEDEEEKEEREKEEEEDKEEEEEEKSAKGKKKKKGYKKDEEAEKARKEAEKAKRDAVKAHQDAEKAKAEAEIARLEKEKAEREKKAASKQKDKVKEEKSKGKKEKKVDKEKALAAAVIAEKAKSEREDKPKKDKKKGKREVEESEEEEEIDPRERERARLEAERLKQEAEQSREEAEKARLEAERLRKEAELAKQEGQKSKEEIEKAKREHEEALKEQERKEQEAREKEARLIVLAEEEKERERRKQEEARKKEEEEQRRKEEEEAQRREEEEERRRQEKEEKEEAKRKEQEKAEALQREKEEEAKQKEAVKQKELEEEERKRREKEEEQQRKEKEKEEEETKRKQEEKEREKEKAKRKKEEEEEDLEERKSDIETAVAISAKKSAEKAKKAKTPEKKTKEEVEDKEARSRKGSEGQERFDSGVNTQEESEEDVKIPVPVVAKEKEQKEKEKEAKPKSSGKKKKQEKKKDKESKEKEKPSTRESKKGAKAAIVATEKEKSKVKSREKVDEPDSRKKSRERSRVNGFEEVVLEEPQDERKSRPATRQPPKAGTPIRSLNVSPVQQTLERTRSPSPYRHPPGRDASVQTNSEDEFEVPDDSPDTELLALEIARKRAESRETTLPTQESPERKRESPLRSSKVQGDGRIQPGLLRKEESRSRTPLIVNGDDLDDGELSPDDRDGPLGFEFYNRRKRVELAERLAREKQRNREREEYLKLQILLERSKANKIKQAKERSQDNTMSDENHYDTSLMKRKPVPKRVNSIQESVRRYQDQRRYVRQLHQLKRAQIYTGPMHDIVLFSKLMDVYKHNPDNEQDLDLTVMDNWDGYLRDDRPEFRSISHTAKEQATRLAKSASDARRRLESREEKLSNYVKQIEERDQRERDEYEGRISNMARKTKDMLDDVQDKADSTLADAKETNQQLDQYYKRERSHRLASGPSRRERSWLKNDEEHDDRQSRLDENERARRERYKDWHKKKNEELRRKLLKVYGNSSELQNGMNGPAPVVKSQQHSTPRSGLTSKSNSGQIFERFVSSSKSSSMGTIGAMGPMKASTPRVSNDNSPRPKSMISSVSGSRAQYNNMDHELNVHMTEFGMRRVKMEDGSFGAASRSSEAGEMKALLCRRQGTLAANWTPKYDGDVRPRAGLVFVEPRIYDEFIREEKEAKKQTLTKAHSRATNLNSVTVDDDNTVLEPVETS